MKIVCTLPVHLYLCIYNNYQNTEHVKTVFPICIQILTGEIYDYQYLSLLLEGNSDVMASVLAYCAVDRVLESW